MRPRGIFSKQQIRGVELMRAGAVAAQGGSIFVVLDGKIKHVANLSAETCVCDAFVHSVPRTACAGMWAARYEVEPPTLDEFNIPEPVGIIVPNRPEIVIPNLDIELLTDTRGGYKRFSKEYDKVLRSEFGQALPFVTRLFKDAEEIFMWREQKPRGRHRVPLWSLLLAAYLYTVLGWAVRPTESFLAWLAKESRSFAEVPFPGFAKISEFIRDPSATPLAHAILALTAEPFRELGPLVFASDGTGSAADRNKFFDYRSMNAGAGRQPRPYRAWFRAHLITGVDTLQTPIVRVTRPYGKLAQNKASDEKTVLRTEMIPALAALDYDIEQFLADAGLDDTQIREDIIDKLGALPFIPWKSNSKTATPRRKKSWQTAIKHGDLLGVLRTMCLQDEGKAFKAAGYRYRVKVECRISATKEKFNPYVRTLEGNGPENEIVWKFIASNVHVLLLAAAVYKLNIGSNPEAA